jgi:hypothetical protein
MSQLNSLLESANSYKSLQSDAARLASKWSKTGLLEGMNSETDKNNMSMILENQAKQLVTENTQTGGGTATMTAGTGPAGQWAGVALPLVRKVFGQIAAIICFGSTNELTIRSSILSRFPIRRN